MLSPSLPLTLFALLASLILVGCEDLLEENQDSNANERQPSIYDDEIETNCEDFCDQEVQCFDLPENRYSVCVQDCIDRTHDIRLQTSRDCFEADLDVVSCEVALGCEELDDVEQHCSSEIADTEQACEETP